MAIPKPVPGNPVATYGSITSLCDAVDALLVLTQTLQAALDGQTTTTSTQSQSIRVIQTGLNQVSDALTANVTQLESVQDALNQQINAAIATEAGQRNDQFADILQTFNDFRSVLSGIQTETDGRLDILEASSGDLTTRLAAVTAQANALTAALIVQRFDFAIAADRPGCVPARFTFVSSASQLGGSRQALPLLPDALLAVSNVGPVVRVRVRGAGILALRQPVFLQDGRPYRFRYGVQRRIDPTDPTGDAVVCGVAYLDQSFRMLGDVVSLQTYPAFAKANGRRVYDALVSRTAGLGSSFSPPDSNSRFAARSSSPMGQTR